MPWAGMSPISCGSNRRSFLGHLISCNAEHGRQQEYASRVAQNPGPPIGTRIANTSHMSFGTVVLLGTLPIEQFVLDLLTSEFGFSFKKLNHVRNLPNLSLREDVAAVLFNPTNLGLEWDEALQSVLAAFPRAFPILCHGFADQIDWPRIADAGAFHSIPLPFNIAELRQSLGFVWGARSNSTPRRVSINSKRNSNAKSVAAIHLAGAGVVA